MTTPTRGLNLAHYMQFAFTPIIRATITPGEVITPAQYYENTIRHNITVEDAEGYDFALGTLPDPIADVEVTVKSIGCYGVCSDGINFYWGTYLPPPNPPWTFAPWVCSAGCDPDDPECSPDDCTEQTVTFSILYEEWIAKFTGIIGSYTGYPFSEGCEEGPCPDRYIELTIKFLTSNAVIGPDVIEQDLSYPPHHGWATWHTTIPGNNPGVLSKALGENRVDPDFARTVSYHEWAPPDDPTDIRYAVGGLTGIHQRPAVEGELGDLAHGSVIQQRIQGQVTYFRTETDCAQL